MIDKNLIEFSLLNIKIDCLNLLTINFFIKKLISVKIKNRFKSSIIYYRKT